MVEPRLKNDILERLDRLPRHLQKRVVDFADALVASEPQGVPGIKLLKFAGAIDRQSLQEMEQAIEEGCESRDHHFGEVQGLVTETWRRERP